MDAIKLNELNSRKKKPKIYVRNADCIQAVVIDAASENDLLSVNQCVVSWINKLYVRRRKWIRRYISPFYFTGTTRSSQKAESINSVVVSFKPKPNFNFTNYLITYRQDSPTRKLHYVD